MKLENVTLEMSLKPFWNPTEKNCKKICQEMFRQWEPLYRNSDRVSVMLWIGDGSEILDYRGKLEDKFDWGRYIGCINRVPTEERLKMDPECRQLHTKGRVYREDTEEIDYCFLKKLIDIIKSVGKKCLKKEISLVATFDPGPEFAKSSFKYERHPEVCSASFGDHKNDVVCSTAHLKGDNYNYAGFPSGIPEGTPFGVFMGRQAKCFLHDLGFSAIWFSNGFGFGTSPWNNHGLLFDGEKYYPEKADIAGKKVLEFWKFFKKECPEYSVFVRGTNMSTGIDLASDGVPLKELYHGGFMAVPPVNSPWAALNMNFGLELAGWMSHIAELPADSFCFRFYIHDPWWINSPWLDRYEREPSDIYLPMSVSRVDENGLTQTASSINFLSVDDSQGNMPEQVPFEVIPHIMEACKHAPDEAGPIVWIYPFDEYHEWISPEGKRIDEVMFGDLFISDVINRGLPLNTVCSVSNFINNKKKKNQFLSNRILISPVPDADSDWEKNLLKHIEQGGQLLLYGPLRYAGKNIRNLLKIEIDKPLDGEMSIKLDDNLNSLVKNFAPNWDFEHNSSISAGGIEETGGENILAEIHQNDKKRTYSTEAIYGKGHLIWFRGSSSRFGSCNPTEKIREGHLVPFESELFYPERLVPALFERFGWSFIFHQQDERQREPVMAISRNHNAFYLSGTNHNTFIEVSIGTPFGAPLITGTEQKVANNISLYRLPRTWHYECRVFAKQKNKNIVSCREALLAMPEITRSLRINGLDEAELIIFTDIDNGNKPLILQNPKNPYVNNDFIEVEFVEKNGYKFYKSKGKVSGHVIVCW
jgi:hypothetical protein